jgi:hypothetical protein
MPTHLDDMVGGMQERQTLPIFSPSARSNPSAGATTVAEAVAPMQHDDDHR